MATAVWFLLACHADDGERSAAAQPEAAARSTATVPNAESGGMDPTDPAAVLASIGPLRRGGQQAILLNRECELCHQAQAKAWRSSRHHRAATNAAYEKGFALEPSSFCTSCHAPEARDPAVPSKAEKELGVGCVSCHVLRSKGSGRYTVAAVPREDEVKAPHGIWRSAEFAKTGGCVGCHEFRFPGRHGQDDGAWMQTTVRELQRGAPGAGCADCHMPKREGGSSHDFQHVRDPNWLRTKLQVTVSPHRDGGAVFVLRAKGVGHAFPTGDLFRRLKLTTTWHGADGRTLESQRAYLARHFVRRYGQPAGRRLTHDNRVFLTPRVVDVVATKPHRADRMRWTLSLQRVIDIGSGENPDQAVVDSTVVLHQGSLPLKKR